MTSKIPKTSQLYYFLMPEETSKLLGFIKKENCNIYSPRSLNPKPNEWKPNGNPSKICFCPKGLCNEIVVNKVKDNVYVLDSTISPLIEMQCSIRRKFELSRGRIYFRGGYDGRDGWVAFPEELYITFKNVSSFMKKSFLIKQKLYGAYISKECQTFISSGGKLVQF